MRARRKQKWLTRFAVMFALSSASNSARTQFVESGAMKLLHFSMQKYSIKDDDSSLSICLLLSQVKFVIVGCSHLNH
jgi:hypothetical protein